MTHKNTFLFLFLLIFCGGGCRKSDSTQNLKENNEIVVEEERHFLVDVATEKTEKELKKRYGFVANSIGGGFCGAVQEVSLGGVLYRKCTLEEARRIIVESAIVFRNNINSVLNSHFSLDSMP